MSLPGWATRRSNIGLSGLFCLARVCLPPRGGGEEHGLHTVPMPHSPAAVQPHVPATQPGPVILVLVGSKVFDDGWLPGLQWVGVLVGAVSGTHSGEAQVTELLGKGSS